MAIRSFLMHMGIVNLRWKALVKKKSEDLDLEYKKSY